ncbi:MAG: hypothetical protein LBQ68_00900 [Clostridiales bacterium]|jgi:hypothetical protein|nr:hypothetical protein [Clostridiales bacterium]
MRWRYFIFGLGVGLIVLSAILFAAYQLDQSGGAAIPFIQVTDDEIMERASKLGMVRLGELPETSDLPEDEIIELALELGMVFPDTYLALNEPPKEEQPTEELATTDMPPTPEAITAPDTTETSDAAENPGVTETSEPTATPVPPTSTPQPTAEAVDEGDSIHVSIPQGISSFEVSRLLHDVGLVQNADYFNSYMMDQDVAGRIQFGEFDIPKDITADELIRIIIRG